jgi:hypothetical protein
MRYRDLPDHLQDGFARICEHPEFTQDEILRCFLRRLLCDAFVAGHALCDVSRGEMYLVLPHEHVAPQ